MVLRHRNAPRSKPGSFVGDRFAWIAIAVLAIAPLPGCFENTGCLPPGTRIELAPGEERNDLLCVDGRLAVTVPVQAGRHYAALIDVAGGTLGNTRVLVTMTGDPLVEPVVYELGKIEALGNIQGRGFTTRGAGIVTITLTNRTEDTTQPGGQSLLFGDQRNISVRQRVEDLGAEDHGWMPEEATTLTHDGVVVEGALQFGDEYDYFTVELHAGRRYRVHAESTRELTVSTANVDRFGQFNPHVASLGGTEFALLPTAGRPAETKVLAAATETVLIGVQAGNHIGFLDLLADKFTQPFEDFPIRYALSVEEVESLVEPCDESPAPPPDIEWNAIVARADIVFNVTCTELPNEEIESRYGGEGIEAMVRMLPSGTRYLLLLDHAARVQSLYFAGTNFGNLNEVIKDLDKVPVFDTELGATFHRGFLAAATQVRTDVMPLLQPDYATTLTGYSLGGATAAILGLQLQLDGFEVSDVLTFGQPKVTDAPGAARFSGEPLTRVISARDGITTIYAPNYRHYGEQIILLSENHFVFMDQNDPNFDAATDPEVVGSDLTDHTTYLDRLASTLGEVAAVTFCDRAGFIGSAIDGVCR